MRMNRWFSADAHYSHTNIIKFCGRPFSNVWEMNEQLIANHNACVGLNDEWYHVGDFSFRGSTGKTIEILKRLNGKKFMILGNHDKAIKDEEVLHYVEWVKDVYDLTVQDHTVRGKKQLINLYHYSGRVWNKSHWGGWQLFGHSHSGLSEPDDLLAIDVGVDATARRLSTDGILRPEDYRPLCYEEIKAIMAQKTFKPIR